MKKTSKCGCCGGPQRATPADTWNAPHRSALHRRAGTYASFFESMRAELSSNARPGLMALRTRALSDPAVAFADAWAVAADVLTFYQERLSNEGYLRTATERPSVIEIANLIGYRPRPGVAATVHLAYTLDDKSVPVEIPAGSKAQNVPDPGDQMQTFETAEPLQARVEWNELTPKLGLPIGFSFAEAFLINRVRLVGATLDIKPGAVLLASFVDRGNPNRVAHVQRRVAGTTPLFDLGVTDVDLQPRPRVGANAIGKFIAMHDDALAALGGALADEEVAQLMRVFAAYTLGADIDEVRSLAIGAGDANNPLVKIFAQGLRDWAEALQEPVALPLEVAVAPNPLKFISLLDRAPVRVASSSANLSRSVAQTFSETSDAGSRLLTRLRPRAGEEYFHLWRNLPAPKPGPKPSPGLLELAPFKALSFDGLHVFRNMAGLFGSVAPQTVIENGVPKTYDPNLHHSDGPAVLSLESVDESVAPGSLVLLYAPDSSLGARLVGVVDDVATVQRASYLIQGKSTRIQLATPGSKKPLKWRAGSDTKLSVVRSALAFVHSERLALAEPPDESPVKGQIVALGTVYDGLESGRWVIVTGERSDLVVDGVSVQGIQGRELMMIAGVRHVSSVGQKAHTELTFERDLANEYIRTSVRIFANVAKATHGETHEEALGSGNAAQTLQAFELKRDPLTFIPAVTPEGVQTTLETRVNLVRWHETETLAVATPADRAYVVGIGEDGKTTVTFGTGEHGARLPTGTANVRAKYRSGIGKPGNVKADRITLLASRPLGVREVNNPLRASGGAGAETRDQVRANAPLAVAALDRLIGVRDYADFARTFAGIGHADARALTDGIRNKVHVTVAGIDDIPLDEGSDLLKALLEALTRFGDPMLPVEVEPRELLALVVSANITIDRDYLWDDVERRVRGSLIETFSFSRRTLGQAAYVSEAIAAIQSVRGVIAADVDVFDAISEHELNDLSRLQAKVTQLSGGNPDVPQPRPMIPVARARLEKPSKSASPTPNILPAQLAFIVPDVADTVILNRR